MLTLLQSQQMMSKEWYSPGHVVWHVLAFGIFLSIFIWLFTILTKFLKWYMIVMGSEDKWLGQAERIQKKKNSPRDVMVNNISWAVLGKFFFTNSFNFFFFFRNYICFIGVITTSMTATAHRNTTGVNDDNRQPPTPCHSCSHHYCPQGLPFRLILELVCQDALLMYYDIIFGQLTTINWAFLIWALS